MVAHGKVTHIVQLSKSLFLLKYEDCVSCKNKNCRYKKERPKKKQDMTFRFSDQVCHLVSAVLQ